MKLVAASKFLPPKNILSYFLLLLKSHHCGTFNWEKATYKKMSASPEKSHLENSLYRANCVPTCRVHLASQWDESVGSSPQWPCDSVSLAGCVGGSLMKTNYKLKDHWLSGKEQGRRETMIMFTTYKEEKLTETKRSLYFTVIVFFCLWYINRRKCLKSSNWCVHPVSFYLNNPVHVM